MIGYLNRIAKKMLNPNSTPRRRTRTAQLRVERLEEREVLTVTDMTALAALFPRHTGPTMLFLNFDGYASQGVSSFASTSGDRTKDIQDVLFRTSEIFAPFDVQVRRIYGDAAMSTSAGNTTVFIGDKSGNGTGSSNGTYAYTPFSNSDYPGQVQGIKHQPNSDTYDIAYVDGVGATSSWDNATLAGAIAHEAGHTFGLAHVLSSPDPEIMSYDAANTRFVNKTFTLTSLNNNGTSTSNDSRLTPEWYTHFSIFGISLDVPNPIVTQNSYTYLRTALGAPTTGGDAWADVADSSLIDSVYHDLSMPSFSVSTSYSTTGGINTRGDYDVFKMSVPTSKYVKISASQYSSTVDPVLYVYDSTGKSLLAFNDDSGGTRNSSLVFYASAGTNYKIVVGSYGANSTGNYKLSVSNYRFIISPILLDTTLTSSLSSFLTGGGSANFGSGSGQATPVVSDSPLVLPPSQLIDAPVRTAKDAHKVIDLKALEVTSAPARNDLAKLAWGDK